MAETCEHETRGEPTQGLSMKLCSVLVVFLGLQVCQPAIAGSMFRCEVAGQVEFRDRPCRPAKLKSNCKQGDGKALSQEQLHGLCDAPESGTSKLPIVPSANKAASASGGNLPGPLALNALNDVASSTASQLRAPSTDKSDAANILAGGRPAGNGKR